MKKTLLIVSIALMGWALNAQTTPCGFKYGRTESDSLKCLENITTFNLNFKSGNYVDAYQAWQHIVNECPCSWSGIYSNSPKMMNALIKAEQDPERKQRLIDTLLWIYDRYPEMFPESYSKGQGIGFRGYYTMVYRGATEYEKGFEDLVTSVDMEKEKTQPAIWDMYFKTAVKLVPVKQDTSIVVEAYERATEYIDEGIVSAYEKYEADTPQFAILQQQFDKMEIDKIKYDNEVKRLSQDTANQMKFVANYRKTIAQIEKMFVPYASCDILEKMYSSKIDENRENIPALKKMLLTLNKFEECRGSVVYKDILEIVHAKEPGAQTAQMMGSFYLVEKNYDRAAEYFNEAIRLYTTNNQKTQPYYFLAFIEYTKRNYSAARNMAYKALQCNPSFGEAYLLIGDMYAASAGQFNGEDAGVIPGAVYWAAADKYAKAVAVDPSLAAKAQSHRSNLRSVPGEYIFKKGYSKGQSYHVGGWIQENTTVR